MERVKVDKTKRKKRKSLPLEPQFHKYFFKSNKENGPELYHARYDVVKSLQEGNYVNVEGKVIFIRRKGGYTKRAFPTEKEARWAINSTAARKYEYYAEYANYRLKVLETLLRAGLYVDTKKISFEEYSNE